MAALSPGNLRALGVAALVLLSGMGTASATFGLRFGLPHPACVLAALSAAWLARSTDLPGLRGFLLPLGALTAAALVPAAAALRLFTGSALGPFAAALLVSLAWASGRRPPRQALLPFFFAAYALVGWQARVRVGPDGDEPQYLMVAESLRRDHDFALDQDFAEERYREFYSRKLEPHFRIRGPEGQIYSLHAVGLSLLILPAWTLGGYPGVSLFMAFLGALLVREIRRLLQAVTGESATAEGLAWMLGLCPPLIHFAGLVFTEIPAALLVAAGLRSAAFARRGRGPVIAALCAAALPWFNVRYGILSVAIAAALVVRVGRGEEGGRRLVSRARFLLAPGLVALASALALCVFHYSLWGFFDPRRVYGRSREFSLSILPEGLPGLFFDQEFGLFIYAPVYALAFVGAGALWRRHRAVALGAALAVVGVVLTASVWPMWRGGFNPPARFLVPLTPALAAGLALAWPRRAGAALALLTGWSLWCGLFGAASIETVHRDRDGVAPFFRDQAVAREWTTALPSFVLPEDRATRFLALPWALLLAAAVLRARRDAAPPERAGIESAAAVLALMGAAVFADAISPRLRLPERNATRLLGEASISLRSPVFERATSASWARALVYEPHRNPDGVILAGPLRLKAGAWRVTLETDGAAAAAPPALVVATHLLPAPTRQTMAVSGRDFVATYRALREAEYDLRLQGGEPFALSRVRIEPAR